MNRSKIGWMAAGVIAAGIVVLVLWGLPDRLPPEEQIARAEVESRLNQIQEAKEQEKQPEKAEPTDAPSGPDSAPEPEQPAKEEVMLPEEAPDVFKVKFECSNGDIVVECHKDWAPLGVQRFYELVKSGYYDNSAFFRVVPGFVVQFGLAGDPVMTAAWRNKRLQDDPVKESNLPGTLTFATSGPNTRTTQLFINTGNNARLDGMGFAPFAKVVEGMDVVKTINAEYGERPDQGLITAEGNAYVSRNFPNITLINKASFLQ